MALLFVNGGETEGLGRLINKEVPDDCKIHLYETDVTLAETTVIGDLDLITAAEHTDAGPKELTGASWDTATTQGTAAYAQQTFTFASGATAYGYVVTNNDASIALWAEEFTDGPYVIPAGGGTIKVTPTISMD